MPWNLALVKPFSLVGALAPGGGAHAGCLRTASALSAGSRGIAGTATTPPLPRPSKINGAMHSTARCAGTLNLPQVRLAGSWLRRSPVPVSQGHRTGGQTCGRFSFQECIALWKQVGDTPGRAPRPHTYLSSAHKLRTPSMTEKLGMAPFDCAPMALVASEWVHDGAPLRAHSTLCAPRPCTSASLR
jgi:hypothetical protein